MCLIFSTSGWTRNGESHKGSNVANAALSATDNCLLSLICVHPDGKRHSEAKILHQPSRFFNYSSAAITTTAATTEEPALATTAEKTMTSSNITTTATESETLGSPSNKVDSPSTDTAVETVEILSKAAADSSME